MYQQYQAPGGYPPPAGPQQQYGMQYPGNSSKYLLMPSDVTAEHFTDLI